MPEPISVPSTSPIPSATFLGDINTLLRDLSDWCSPRTREKDLAGSTCSGDALSGCESEHGGRMLGA